MRPVFEKRRHIKRLAPLWVLVAFIVTGCSTTQSPSAPEIKRPCPVEVLAVAPILAADPMGESQRVVDPVTTEIFNGQKIDAKTVKFLTAKIPKAVEAHFGCKIVTPERLAGYLPVRPGRPGRPIREALSQAAIQCGAQAVFVGTVYRYQEREGGSFGVQKPAGVYFGFYLIDVRDAKVVWSAYFNETQTSLSENILEAGKFLKRRGRWLTASELADYGLDKIIRSMPSRLPE